MIGDRVVVLASRAHQRRIQAEQAASVVVDLIQPLNWPDWTDEWPPGAGRQSRRRPDARPHQELSGASKPAVEGHAGRAITSFRRGQLT
jgi:hypothetical protein